MTTDHSAQPLEVDDHEFADLTQGDHARARTLRKQLQQLNHGSAGEPLQEMAREILTGRVGVRQALRIPAYAEALGERVQRFRGKWEAMSAEERAELEENARRFLETQRDEIEREKRNRPR